MQVNSEENNLDAFFEMIDSIEDDNQTLINILQHLYTYAMS